MDFSQKPTKFDFDTEFDENGEILREGESYKRFFTQDDIDAARMWGVEEGREEEEGRCAQALLAIASQMQLILSRLALESEQLRHDGANLAFSTAQKISGAALDAYPLETITSLIEEVMADLRSEPRFSVRCTPELAENLTERLEKTAQETGFAGAIIVRGDDSMAAADIRLEWGNGSIQRSASEVESRLKDVIEKWLATPAETTQNPSDESVTNTDASAA
jgi:flagellar assembly protein FliH